MADSPKSIPASDYEPSPVGDLMETSLMGSVRVAADRIRIAAKLSPGATSTELAKMTDTTVSQVKSALKTK